MNRFFRARSVNIKLIKPSKYKYLTLILLIVLGLIISVGHTRAQNLNTLSGVIVDSSNSAVKFATISLLDQNGSVQGTITSGIDGSYSMTVPPGSYSLRFRSPDASDYIDHHLDYLYSSQSGTPIDLSSGDAVINLRLQTATLHVLVNDARGNPVTNASVSVFSKANTGGTMSLYPGDPGETIYGSSSGNNNDSFTNSSGMVDITTVVGENLGTNRNEGSLCAQVSGSYVCLPNPLTIIGDANITLTAPESRNFSGQMVDSIGAAVKYVSIILKSSDGSQSTGYSDGNGMFSIDVKPNVYSLSLLTDGSDPIGQHLDWLNTVQIGTPSIDLTTADISQTLKLDTVNIHVIVKDSDNNLLSNVQVGGAANYADGGTMSLYPGDPGESIRAAYYGVIQPLYTDASGSINLTGIVGEKFGTTHDLGSICANIAGNYTCLVAPTTISGDATITLIKPAIHTLSGTLKDADNNPLKNITLDLLNASGVLKGSVTTDVSGQYSLSMVPGKYRLHVAIANAIDYVGHHLDDLSISQSDTSIDLTLGNVQQGLQLKTSTIHVTVKDVAGNVVANAPVSAKAPTTDGGATQLYAGDPGENIYKANTGTNSDSFTDTNGNVDITTIVGEKFGQTYDAGSICAIVAGNYVCLNSPLTIIGDSNLILQSSSAAPQNLTATSPTQLPTLNWTTVSGATSYNIYRNGAKIDSSTTVTYTDNASAEGAQVYYVTAVNGIGESGHSNSITVLVDRTAPTITYTVSPLPNSGGWNNVSVLITFSCVDSVSGVASCTNPVILNSEGANQTITGSAADNAGNIALVTTTSINIDETAPALGAPSWASNPIAASQSTILTIPVSDNLSGAVGGEYYIGSTNPGQGNGVAMTFNGVNITTNVGANLAPGTYTINYRAKDTAGNWNMPQATTLTVLSALPSAPTGLSALTPTMAPALSWDTVSGADSYNIYRNGLKIGSHITATYTDSSAPEGTNTYYVTAANANGESVPSNSITIVVDSTVPIITYTESPSPNAGGWNNTSVTITFNCSDALSGVASCSSPVTLNTEGVNQVVTGVATDKVGNTASITTSVKLDKTLPSVTMPIWTNNPLLRGQNTTLSTTASDSLSGIGNVQYSIDGGTPQPMTYDAVSGTWKVTFGSNLDANTYNVTITATDTAGNTNSTTDVLAVYVATNGYVTGHAKTLPTASDTLPIARDTSTNPTKLVMGFTNVTAPSSGSFDLNYKVKNNQNEFSLSSNSINWVVVQDSTHASILGHADLTTYVNGVKTVIQNVAVHLDIVIGTNGLADQVTVKIFNPGVDPNTGIPAYVISDTVIANGSNLMIHP